MIVQCVAKLCCAEAAIQHDLGDLAGGMHARIGPSGADAGQPARRSSAAPLPSPAPPARIIRWSDAASRQTALRHIPAAAPIGPSAKARAGGNRMAAQEGGGVQRGAAGKLHPRQPHCAVAAANQQRVVQHHPGFAGNRFGMPASTFSVDPASRVKLPGQGSNARIWRSIASASRVQSMRPSARLSRAHSWRLGWLRDRPGDLHRARAGSARRPGRPARRAASPPSRAAGSAPIGQQYRTGIQPGIHPHDGDPGRANRRRGWRPGSARRRASAAAGWRGCSGSRAAAHPASAAAGSAHRRPPRRHRERGPRTLSARRYRRATGRRCDDEPELLGRRLHWARPGGVAATGRARRLAIHRRDLVAGPVQRQQRRHGEVRTAHEGQTHFAYRAAASSRFCRISLASRRRMMLRLRLDR